ncbi:MAG: SemiSWEET transporter [Candidatus Gribaldobacteria bacterium]|nr:SemiSWEET transporter [Candidatus Gribaldobacteria bacterium]
MNYIVILGLVAAALTTFSSLPQVVKIIKIKETKDISLGMYVLVVAGIILWLVYGLLIGDLPLITANVVSLIFTATILGFKIKYK